MNIKKPIFIVGHARGGSTLLASIVNAHSAVGPKHQKSENYNPDDFKNYIRHLEFSEKLEQKDIWFKYFKGKDCFTHMGKEIYESSITLNAGKIQNLKRELTKDFKEERFLSKAPTNSFRLKPILKIFPDSKIVVVLRHGEEVVASWGKRPYGFGKKVDWGNVKTKKLSYFKGINIFSKKWKEVIDVIEEVQDLSNIYILTYEDLVKNTTEVLSEVFEFLELDYENYIDEIRLKYDRSKWKKELPFPYRLYLLAKVRKGNKKIEKLKTNA